MTKFQVVFIGVLLLLIVSAVIVFSLAKSNSVATPQLAVWGTLGTDLFNGFVQKYQEQSGEILNIIYTQKPAATFETQFVEAIASGKGPDIVFLPQDMIMNQKEYVTPIPYASYPERTFKETFIEEGELYLSPLGVLAVPFIVDPIVMYWNRDMFSAASLVAPPKYWDELPMVVEKLTKKDTAFNISKSAIALGEFSNIAHAKEILSAIFIQANNPITAYSANGTVRSVLNDTLGYTVAPAETAVSFYSQFSNPSLDIYSWSASLENSTNEFIAEDLAIYFGFASELANLRAKNPNLNFDVAVFPQVRNLDNPRKVTYGALTGLAIVRTSQYQQQAFATIATLTSAESLNNWIAYTNLPPVRRDMLAARPGSAALSVFYDSALWSRGWLDPDKEKSKVIFKNLVETISTGRARVTEAVSRAHQELDKLLPR